MDYHIKYRKFDFQFYTIKKAPKSKADFGAFFLQFVNSYLSSSG